MVLLSFPLRSDVIGFLISVLRRMRVVQVLWLKVEYTEIQQMNSENKLMESFSAEMHSIMGGLPNNYNVEARHI